MKMDIDKYQKPYDSCQFIIAASLGELGEEGVSLLKRTCAPTRQRTTTWFKDKGSASGFTLVELSIVIVVISLITAGIFSGQKLVQQAKLNNIIKETRELDTAIHQFKEKFKYYPGDLPNAESYWGTYSAGPPITGATNGNGDWSIALASTESYQFWRELALAGFIPGTYSGAAGTPLLDAPGINIPKSTLDGGGWIVVYSTGTFYETTGTVLSFASLTGSTSNRLNGYILNPADAYLIDKKIDDGLAASGNLYASRASSNSGNNVCTSDYFTSSTATYLLNDPTVSCRLYWWLDKNK